MPKFSFPNFACRRFGRRRLRQVVLKETEVVHEGGGNGEASAQASASGEEAVTQEHFNRATAANPKDGTNNREKSLEVTKELLAVVPADEDQYRAQEPENSGTDDVSNGDSNHLEEFLQAAKLTFAGAKTVSSVLPFPGSGVVFDVLSGIIDFVQTKKGNDESNESLRTWILELQRLLPSNASDWSDEYRSIIDDFKSDVVKQLKPCATWESKSLAYKFIFAKIDEEKLSALSGCVSKAVQKFHVRLDIENARSNTQVQQSLRVVHNKVNEEALRRVIDQLPKLAAYDSNRTRELIPCHPGTCEVILKEVKTWAMAEIGGKQPQVMWLCGRAGTGKSTIATTIASWADKEKHFLGGNYFFSRDVEGLSSCSHVIPTIAYHLSEHLSEHNPLFNEAVRSRLVARNGHVLNQKIEEQFENLIREPLRLTYNPRVPRERTLLVIDGLDECDDQRKLKDLINLLLSMLSPTNAHIRILLVSRPEKHIEDALSSEKGLHPHVVRHNVEDFVTTSDVEEYLRLELFKIGKADWPSGDDFNSLAESCGQLFVYASTVINFIREETALRNHKKSLQILLSVRLSSEGHGAANAYRRLDELYLQILRVAVGDADEVDSEAMIRFRKALGTIALSRNPLSVSSIAHLIGVEEEEIWTILEFLRSVIIVPPQASEDRKNPPRFYHPSLPEFLMDGGRCKDKRFFIAAPLMEAYLFQRCVDIVIKGSTGIVNEDYIPTMYYVCWFWGYHLGKVEYETEQVMTKLGEFVRRHLLKWIRFARMLFRLCDPLYGCMEAAQNWVVCDRQCKC
ncbi:hypothetical protein SCHPADRAFT_641456, partial [Schizopora paradoxa]